MPFQRFGRFISQIIFSKCISPLLTLSLKICPHTFDDNNLTCYYRSTRYKIMSQLSASITHNDKHNFLINMYRVFAPMSQQLEKACPTTIVSYTNILALMVHDTPVLARREARTSRDSHICSATRCGELPHYIYRCCLVGQITRSKKPPWECFVGCLSPLARRGRSTDRSGSWLARNATYGRFPAH